MKQFDFISNIEEEAKNPKTKFQLFEIEMGFEKVQVLIPLEKSDDFFEVVKNSKPKSKASLSSFVNQFNGKFQ